MAFEHPLVADAFDRASARPDTTEVVMREGAKFYAQGADVNEGFSIARRRSRRVADTIMKDGDRKNGADAIVDYEVGTIHCYAGQVYVEGDIYPVPEALLEDVPMVGEVSVGVRILRTVVTELQDPSLYGLSPGTAAEGEPGAARVVATAEWGFQGDGAPGELYAVYRLKDGTIINQLPPPALSGVIEQLSIYDRESHGNYIVDGCLVTALGGSGGVQSFSIGAGTANISGYKRVRETAFRHFEPETADVELIAGETQTFTGATGGSTTITVNRAPYQDIQLAIVVKRITAENVVRGTTPGGFDALSQSSAFEVESISQGGTAIANTAYTLVNGTISWGPAGAEPAANSTYQVTYLHYQAVTPTAMNGIQLTVSGGVQGRPIQITYNSKIPRIDALCLDIMGRPVYRKGISARVNAAPPQIPSDLLKLAEIYNDWINVPVVANNGTPNVPYDEMVRYFRLLVNIADQFSRSSAENNIQASTLVAKGKIFTDTFVSDYFRDQGAPQTAAINQGVLQLAVDNVLMQAIASPVSTMLFTEEVILSQPQRTSSMKINPWDNFTPMPAGMKIEPPVDRWTESVTTWTSPVTQEFSAAPDRPPGETIIDQVARRQITVAQFLRQITLAVKLEGFGVGENLASLTLDGVSVKPAGTQTANASGEITLSAVIPPNMPAGRRRMRAVGAAGSFAESIYVGEGVIDVTTMQRVTLVTRAAPIPVVINNTTIIQQTINEITQISNPIVPTRTTSEDNDDGPMDRGGVDPLAQSFRLNEGRMVTGINVWCTAVGDRSRGVRIQLATMANGFPTTEILAEDFIPMTTVQVGDKLQAHFDIPVYLSPLREYCYVVLTSDSTHAVAISRLGDVVGTGLTQERVARQPYTVGELFSSSNRITWTTNPDADMAFEIVGARFTQTSRTVNLWTGPLTQISDILVRGTVDLPTQDTNFRYEIVRADGRVLRIQPGQNLEFTEYVTETVTLRAVMIGTALVSPVLFPGTLLAGGRIRTTGTYITRVTPMGTPADVYALFAARIPVGASVTADVDKADNNWNAMTLDSTGILGNNWTEPKYKRTAFSTTNGRVRLTLNGGPAARVLVSSLRAYPV